MKECLPLTKSSDPAYVPDWASWGAESRTALQESAARADGTLVPRMVAALEGAADTVPPPGAHSAPSPAAEAKAASLFDTAIAGPWMGRWAMVNHNRHTERYLLDKVNGGSTWHGLAAGGAFG